MIKANLIAAAGNGTEGTLDFTQKLVILLSGLLSSLSLTAIGPVLPSIAQHLAHGPNDAMLVKQLIGAVTLAPSTEPGKSSGLTFHYPPYAVGPYVEGQYVAFVPWETLKPYLSPDGAAIFGGARPQGDDDGSR